MTAPWLALSYREYRIRLSNAVLPLWDVLVPAVYLVLFGGSMQKWMGERLGGVDYPLFLLGSCIAMVTFSVAMNSSYAYFEDLQSGIFHESLTYPFARHELLLGKLIFNAGFSVVGSLICYLVGLVFLGTRVPLLQLLMLAVVVLFSSAGWYFFYTWISLKARGFNMFHTTTSSLYLLLMFVSNMFYPASELPPVVRFIAALNPVTWQVNVMRYLTGAIPYYPYFWHEVAAFTAFTIGMFWAAHHVLNGPIE